MSEEKRQLSEKKLKFPLLKGADSLENLLAELAGGDLELLKTMQHGEPHTRNSGIIKHQSEVIDKHSDGGIQILDGNNSLHRSVNQKEQSYEKDTYIGGDLIKEDTSNYHLSAKPGRHNRGLKSLQYPDLYVADGHGSEGGVKSPIRYKWNSTHQMSHSVGSYEGETNN